MSTKLGIKTSLSFAIIATCVNNAAVASDVEAAHKNAWGENIGWTNWRDAGNPAGTQGVQIHGSFLSGFVWAENVGWLNLGDGDPGAAGGNEVNYANAAGVDFGVNLDPGTTELFGLAWGENIGWIDFEGGLLAIPAKPARIEAGRLRGFAWGENVGWISFDDPTHFVGVNLACNPCDTNCDGSVNQFDIVPFVASILAAEPPCGPCASDTNADGSINQFDITKFVECLGG